VADSDPEPDRDRRHDGDCQGRSDDHQAAQDSQGCRRRHPRGYAGGQEGRPRSDFKKGTKWVKAKTASATVTAPGTYSWKHKPLKKGAFRVKASIATTRDVQGPKDGVQDAQGEMKPLPAAAAGR